MSWEGNYWGTGGALEVARKRFSNSNKAGSDHVAYASELYAAGGRAFAELRISFRRLNVFEVCLWFWRMLTCGYRSVSHIDMAWKGHDATDFTLDEIDVSFAVWLRIRRKQRVRGLIPDPLSEAISNFSTAKSHTRAFIVSHAFTSGYWKRSAEWIYFMELMAQQTEDSGDLGQASRVWKHIALHWGKMPGHEEDAERTLQMADKFALRSSPDQIRKLTAV